MPNCGAASSIQARAILHIDGSIIDLPMETLEVSEYPSAVFEAYQM